MSDIGDKYSTKDYDVMPDRTAWRDDVIYDIEKLWTLTNEMKAVEVEIDQLTWVMEVDHWSDLDGVHGKDITDESIKNEKYISANDVLKNPLIYLHHFDLISFADLSYPILLIKLPNDKLDVIDGIHRLSKAYVQKQKTISAIVVPQKNTARSNCKEKIKKKTIVWLF
jgi:hypothetical protein